MDSILISWNDGNGNIVVSGDGGDIKISSDTINNGVERQQVLTFRTDVGDVTVTLTVTQKGNRVALRDVKLLELRDSSGKLLTAKK